MGFMFSQLVTFEMFLPDVSLICFFTACAYLAQCVFVVLYVDVRSIYSHIVRCSCSASSTYLMSDLLFSCLFSVMPLGVFCFVFTL